MSNRYYSLRLLACIASAALFSACASIDFDYPRSESYVLANTADTFLAKEAAEASAGRPPDQSGFHPLSSGIDALAARLLLARRAERSIDVQYYLIKADKAGLLLINELLEAADRGVRVRILVDDILTKGYDRGMVAMNAHPNIQIRVFNPFARRSARALNFLGDFRRLNRRMHNKSFTADNQYTIIGGRNIGDEYRYILDRKYAKKYPGNMLERPSLLLNPWDIRSTETGTQEARAGVVVGIEQRDEAVGVGQILLG